jgi:rubrerythrin
MEIKTFNNTKVRSGEVIRDTRKHVLELQRWAEAKYNKNILDAKKEDTKKKRIAEKNEMMRFYRSNAIQLKLIFDLMNLIVEAKNKIIRKLETIKTSVDTFVRTDDGYKITGPEGFVAVSTMTGGALKLVDRLSFSHENFTAAKNWIKK